jgi:hypothetical protein
MSCGGRFAVRFVETPFVALSIVGFAEDDSFRVEDFGSTVSTLISHSNLEDSVAVSAGSPKG